VQIHGINTYWAIALVHTTFFLPIVIFLYTGFIRTIPKELDEAALIDGCSRYEIFFRIIFPLLKPVTASVIIVIMLGVWNDYRFSLFLLQRRSVQTVPLVLSQFFSQFQNNLPLAAAGSLLSMVPMALVYLFLQRYFISGLAEGAVKG
jgi:raffinose/stachyose/melibiose transport system permease protein